MDPTYEANTNTKPATDRALCAALGVVSLTLRAGCYELRATRQQAQEVAQLGLDVYDAGAGKWWARAAWQRGRPLPK